MQSVQFFVVDVLFYGHVYLFNWKKILTIVKREQFDVFTCVERNLVAMKGAPGYEDVLPMYLRLLELFLVLLTG